MAEMYDILIASAGEPVGADGSLGREAQAVMLLQHVQEFRDEA